MLGLFPKKLGECIILIHLRTLECFDALLIKIYFMFLIIIKHGFSFPHSSGRHTKGLKPTDK